jgi:hypothetical protein
VTTTALGRKMSSWRLPGGWLLTRARLDQPVPAADAIKRDQKLGVVRGNMENLRQEASGWMQSQSGLWRTALAGIAAVLILDRDVNLVRFLPLVPTLGMAMLLQWLAQTFMVFRIGKALAVEEATTNCLLEGDVLRHELTLWTMRRKNLGWGEKTNKLTVAIPLAYGVGAAVLFSGHMLLVGWALDHPDLDLAPDLEPLYWVAAVAAAAIAALMLGRLPPGSKTAGPPN